jgi:hypothetical protein
MASSDSRERRSDHRRALRGVRRWWIEAIGPGPFTAYDASVVLVGKSHWRGELLDGAALAAQQLNLSDLAERLAAAWHAAPTWRDYCDGWSPRIAAQPLFG